MTELKAFEEYFDNKGEKWNGKLDIKQFAKEIWIDATKNEKKECIKSIESFFSTDDHGFLNVIKMGLIEYIRSRG